MATVLQGWKDAIRRSELPTHSRMLLFIYAEYCRRTDPGARDVWVELDTLCAETGMTVNTVTKYRAIAVKAGWLVVTKPAAGHRVARYALRIPASRVTNCGGLEEASEAGSESQTVGSWTESQSHKLEGPESQTEGFRPPRFGNDLEDLEGPRNKPGFVGTSPPRASTEKPDDEWLDDDPWIRQQETEPPPHVAQQFRAVVLAATAPNGHQPDLAVCSHGVMLGLALGGGELACCPIPETEDP